MQINGDGPLCTNRLPKLPVHRTRSTIFAEKKIYIHKDFKLREDELSIFWHLRSFLDMEVFILHWTHLRFFSHTDVLSG